MSLFLKRFLVSIFLCAAVVLSSYSASAQYYVPQDKKGTPNAPLIFNKPSTRMTTPNQSYTNRDNGKSAPISEIFPLDEFASAQSSLEHLPAGNRMSVPDYSGIYGDFTPSTAQAAECSPKEKSALVAIQKYQERKLKGLLPTASDKKVAAFMAIPDNAQKAQNVASRCGMDIGQ